MGKVLGAIGTIIIIGIIIAAVLFFKGGSGAGGDGSETKDSSTEQETREEEKEDVPEILSKQVIVTVKEDKVFVGDKEFDNESDFRDYIEEITNDERQFRLKDENSILETYEWASKVFDDLNITLIKE